MYREEWQSPLAAGFRWGWKIIVAVCASTVPDFSVLPIFCVFQGCCTVFPYTSPYFIPN